MSDRSSPVMVLFRVVVRDLRLGPELGTEVDGSIY